MKYKIKEALKSYSKFTSHSKALYVNELFKCLIALQICNVIDNEEYDEIILLLHLYIADNDLYFEMCKVMAK